MSKTNPKAPSLAHAKLTDEQKFEAQARAMMQQRNGMAQIFAANICSNTPYDTLKEYGAKDVAKFSGELADAMMHEFYGADA